MKLFKVWQTENHDYDTYDSFIVAATDMEKARRIVPLSEGSYGDWAFKLESVQVEEIGTAKRGTKSGTILGSFNAG